MSNVLITIGVIGVINATFAVCLGRKITKTFSPKEIRAFLNRM